MEIMTLYQQEGHHYKKNNQNHYFQYSEIKQFLSTNVEKLLHATFRMPSGKKKTKLKILQIT